MGRYDTTIDGFSELLVVVGILGFFFALLCASPGYVILGVAERLASDCPEPEPVVCPEPEVWMLPAGDTGANESPPRQTEAP